MHAVVVGNVVPVVAVRRGIERLQPKTGNAEPRQVVETLNEACKVADPVAVAVDVLLDVEAVDDRVLVPKVLNQRRCCLASTSSVCGTERPWSGHRNLPRVHASN
jgi:hypothetical protein